MPNETISKHRSKYTKVEVDKRNRFIMHAISTTSKEQSNYRDKRQVTVSEGYQISDRVQVKLKEAHPSVTEAMVHIDPEDDETVSTTIDLTPREDVFERLKACWTSLEAAKSSE